MAIKKSEFLTLLAVLVFVPGLALVGVQAEASYVEPTYYDGNPSCTDLGYDFGWKPQPEPPPSGSYTFPDGIHTLDLVSDGTYFDWTSTLSLDAVIVKGGPNANVYIYDPPAESSADTGLHTPINPNNGRPYAISHIEVCYDYEVTVTKTAETSFTRTYDWTIDKSVTPAIWDLFDGDTGTSDYTVAVEKTGYTDSDFAVGGSITVDNDTPFDATLTAVTDDVEGETADVDCEVELPYVLVAGASLNCTYRADLPDGTQRLNTATAATDPAGTVGGGTGTADVVFTDPTLEINDSITVNDSNGGSWDFSDTGDVTYSRTFGCNDDEGSHDNTATIVETGQSASATVTVNCYDLEVSKTANPAFDRFYHWTIDKVENGGHTDLVLATGETFVLNYTVTVDKTGYTDDHYEVTGGIMVHNPASMGAVINSVTDLMSGDPPIPGSVDCGESFPYTLGAGQTLSCTYAASLPDRDTRMNTATAALQNFAFDADGTDTMLGTTGFSGQAQIVFNANTPFDPFDACVDVTDTFSGSLGPVCLADAPKQFTYPRDVVYDVCGQYTVDNTASFVAQDTGATGADNWIVNVSVPCDGGCTLTQGYWKTHSQQGPAPYDENWQNLGDVDGDGESEEEGEDFFDTGMTWYDTLWTPPRGNAFYNLAHQYMAAVLNIVNEASLPGCEIQATIVEAAGLLDEYDTQQDNIKGAVRKDFIGIAAVLDQYNNGLLPGCPPHCSE